MSAQPGSTGHTQVGEPVQIPLSDYPHWQELIAAESIDQWPASLGIGVHTENESMA